MTQEGANCPLIRTKLHRPPVPADTLYRERLHTMLDEAAQCPFTLVSAGAGYGKSTLISHWLERSNIPFAWLSLDERDNDLRSFISYVAAAVQTVFPEAFREISLLLKELGLPSPPVIAPLFINDIEQINSPFILVLDDYYHVENLAVHELITALLRHPSALMHLVIISRHDPPLPLTALRARSRMADIRCEHLRFTKPETVKFFERLKLSLDDESAVVIEHKAEGWATGLRLAALSLQHENDLRSQFDKMQGDSGYIVDYLISEVLNKQSPEVQEYLLKTSVLDRFCGALCEAICCRDEFCIQDCEVRCRENRELKEAGIKGEDFLCWAQQKNLFLIELDSEQRWFRYHHLFRDLLRHRLKLSFDPNCIAGRYKRASQWFEEQGLLDEALEYALKSGDPDFASEFVARHGQILMNQEDWFRLNRWLSQLPAASVDRDPLLLVFKCWCDETFNRLSYLETSLELADTLLKGSEVNTSKAGRVAAEICVLRSRLAYERTDAKAAFEHSQHALETLPSFAWSSISFARIIEVMSLQALGDLKKCYAVVHENFRQKNATPSYRARLIIAKCFVQWMAADLSGLFQTVMQHHRFGEEQQLPQTIKLSQYFLGLAHYHRNELSEAEECFTAMLKDGFRSDVDMLAHGAFALLFGYQARGRKDLADQILELVHAQAVDSGDQELWRWCEAVGAELALRRGSIAEAATWAKNFTCVQKSPLYRFYLPELTLVRVLLAQNTAESLQQAETVLLNLEEHYTSNHGSYFLMNIWTLKAVLFDLQGDEALALESLQKAINIGESGRYIRPFLDYAPEIGKLLTMLTSHKDRTNYLNELLSAFQSTDQLTRIKVRKRYPQGELAEELTNREFEILKLLNERLQNKEIAQKLFISPTTVKRHTSNIYQKLGVNSRREAARKASRLGLV